MTPSEDVRELPSGATQPAPEGPGTYRHERHLQGQLRRGAAMAPDRAVALEHVRDVILKDLDRRTGQSGGWEVGFVRRARDSWLFKASTARAPWPLAVKVYCEAAPKGLPARQLAALKHYHGAMASAPALTVPAPWAALPEHRTLIMEWIEAPRLDHLLKAARKRQERDRLIAAAGRWLRHFHDQGDHSLRPLGDIDLLRPIDTFLGGADGSGVRDLHMRAAYGVLRKTARDHAGTKIPFVTSHGDFSPANMFLDATRTVGFDFKATAARPPARDILHFLIYARSFNTSPWMLLDPRLDTDDLAAFLAAYGPLDALDERLITMFRLAEALYSWSLLIDRMHREGRSLRGLARAFRLRGIARRAANSLTSG